MDKIFNKVRVKEQQAEDEKQEEEDRENYDVGEVIDNKIIDKKENKEGGITEVYEKESTVNSMVLGPYCESYRIKGLD